MKEVSIIGVDLAKQVFQLHGATAEGEVVFRKKLSRKQFLAFMQMHPGCLVAMEACATAHHWARTLVAFGHEVRLIARKSIHVPGTLEELVWPTSGIPKAIHVDNAQEFHSEAFSSACEDWGIAVDYRPPGATHFGGHIERLIGTAMGAVHVLPGTTQSSAAEKGDYDSEKYAALTLAEFEDWLHLEICRYHNTRHEALGRTPLAAWADLGGDTAGRQVVDVEAFRTSFLPSERRQLGRTGITLFGVHYWSDAFASLVGRGSGKVHVKYDPRDLSQVWVLVDDGRMIPARYRDLSHPRISLWESRWARKEWQDKHGGRINEKALFQVIDAQRRLAEAARQKTRTARLESERETRLPKHQPSRDPSREMFAIDVNRLRTIVARSNAIQ